MATTAATARRQDLVVIGASAGGVTALPALTSTLPPELPAAVLIVQHLPTSGPQRLVDILQSISRLPVSWAKGGDLLEHGTIAIAPPGSHLLVEGDRMMLSSGPRENHAKPSINRLFRSAAAHRGNRTIGVLLTGLLDDGVAGIDAIKWCGGTVLVQDPAEAEYPDLPRSAIEEVAVDRVAPLAELGGAIAELAGRTVVPQPIPSELELHAALDRAVRGDARSLDALGSRDLAMCPDCGGPLWRVARDRAEIYRCYLGHTMSCRILLRDQAMATEQAMWNALRSLEESAFTLSSRAIHARERGDLVRAIRLDEQVERLQLQASRQRELIMDLQFMDGIQ